MDQDDSFVITENERALLATLDNLNMLDSRIKQLSAIEAEEVEAESWNVDVLQQLIEVADTVGHIPFSSATDLYELAPSGPRAEADGADTKGAEAQARTTPDALQSAGSGSKGKGKARDVAQEPPVKRAIFNLDPRDAEHTWWCGPRDEDGAFAINAASSSKSFGRSSS
jgi:hypothetical protein